MRFFAPPASAEAWQDRSPSNAGDGYTGALTNDAGSTRVTYTVPAGRRAFVGALNLSLEVTTDDPAATIGRLSATITPSGESAYSIGAIGIDPTVKGITAGVFGNVNAFLEPGDNITITSYQPNATAVVQAFCGVAITEFDA